MVAWRCRPDAVNRSWPADNQPAPTTVARSNNFEFAFQEISSLIDPQPGCNVVRCLRGTLGCPGANPRSAPSQRQEHRLHRCVHERFHDGNLFVAPFWWAKNLAL